MALEDRVEIALDVGTPEHRDHRPLDRLSAGQRSTAILLLALLESDGPLILDQPEDDLDNRFIYERVVRRLRDTKEQRQFLIATHKANIPVLGDAEQIVILAAEQDGDGLRAHVAQRGSIDDEGAARTVRGCARGRARGVRAPQAEVRILSRRCPQVSGFGLIMAVRPRKAPPRNTAKCYGGDAPVMHSLLTR